MKKIISFSLYGGQQKYSYGMISNVEIAQVIFPDWICRIYYGKSFSGKIKEIAIRKPHCQVLQLPLFDAHYF